MSDMTQKTARRAPGSPMRRSDMSSAESRSRISSTASGASRALHETMIDLRVLPAAARNAR